MIRMLDDLGIDTDISLKALEPMFKHVNELPIYPSTASILNLEWINTETKYRMNCYDGVQSVSFEEYMEKLIRYYKDVKSIKRMLLGKCDKMKN